MSLFKTLYVILELILINEGRSEMDDGWALLESAYILQLYALSAFRSLTVLLSLRQSERQIVRYYFCATVKKRRRVSISK